MLKFGECLRSFARAFSFRRRLPCDAVCDYVELLKFLGAMLRPVRAKHAARHDAQGHSPCSPRRAWHPESVGIQQSLTVSVLLRAGSAVIPRLGAFLLATIERFLVKNRTIAELNPATM